MGILETVYMIVSTICCTLKKDKNAEDIKIKIDEIHNDKTEDNQEYSNDATIVKVTIEPGIKNMIQLCPSSQMFAEQCRQQQQNSSIIKEKSQMTIVSNNCCCCFDESHNVRLIYPCLLVNSTRNSQSNCSIDNATKSTFYIPYHKEKIQDVINKNRTCPLTSTNQINSKRQCSLRKCSLRKFTAAIFRPFC